MAENAATRPLVEKRSLGAAVAQGIASGLSAGAGTVAAQKLLGKGGGNKPKEAPKK